MSEDREKRSWREIDRMRDGSGGSSPKPPGRPRRNDRASERYKAMLDKAFERGEMGKVMDQLSSVSPQAEQSTSSKKKGPSRQKLLHAITSATTPSKALEAFERFREAFGLPEDAEALLPGLDHRDQQVVLDVLNKLDEVIEKHGAPRRSKTLAVKLRMIEDDFNADPEAQELAGRLAARL